MFIRPPLIPTVGLVLGVAVCVYLFITPIEGPTWLPAIAPLSYGVVELRGAAGVVIPGTRPGDCETVGNQAAIWRALVASRSGDKAFRRLFLRGNANGRVYALVGLTQLGARGLSAAIAASRRDTAQVYIWHWNTLRGTHRTLRQVAIPDTLAAWAHLLMGSPPAHPCET